MSKTCKSCAHWDNKDSDGHPVEFNGDYGLCNYAEEKFRWTDPELRYGGFHEFAVKPGAPKMLADDGSDYVADLFTHESHGCLQHKDRVE